MTDPNHTPEELTTIWYIHNEVVCDDIIPNQDGETECEVVLGADDIEITLAVRDPENARHDDTLRYRLSQQNRQRLRLSLQLRMEFIIRISLITFEGIVSDAEDDSELLVAHWESMDEILSSVDSIPNNAGQVLGYGMLSEGQHAVELHVEDTTGKTFTEAVIIQVGPPNSSPLCEIVTPSDGSAGAEGQTVEFTATTSDVDIPSDMLSVTLISDKDGEIGTSIPDSSG